MKLMKTTLLVCVLVMVVKGEDEFVTREEFQVPDNSLAAE